MAKTKTESGAVKVRVLVDCDLGKADDVVAIDAELVGALVGIVDANAEAVAYAESLKA